MRKSGKVVVMAAVAAISAVSYADWSSEVYTNEINEVKWRFRIDTSNNRALLGVGVQSGSDVESNWGTTSKDLFPAKADFPSSFTVDGSSYTLSSIGDRSFIRCNSMTDISIPVTIPGSFFYIYQCAFYECKNLDNVYFKGPSSQYATLIPYSNAFGLCEAMKYILVSPTIRKHKDYDLKLASSSGATIVAPLNSDNTSWENNVIGGTGNSMLFYSEMDEAAKTITFSPTNAATLAVALNAVAPHKNRFGFSTIISITNRIDEITAIPEEAVPYTTFDLRSWVTFKVTTQKQLENTLAAVPVDSPIIIDPTGATEILTIPSGRAVFVRCDEGDSISKKITGLKIRFL